MPPEVYVWLSNSACGVRYAVIGVRADSVCRVSVSRGVGERGVGVSRGVGGVSEGVERATVVCLVSASPLTSVWTLNREIDLFAVRWATIWACGVA